MSVMFLKREGLWSYVTGPAYYPPWVNKISSKVGLENRPESELNQSFGQSKLLEERIENKDSKEKGSKMVKGKRIAGWEESSLFLDQCYIWEGFCFHCISLQNSFWYFVIWLWVLLYFCIDEPSGRISLIDKVFPGASILNYSFPIEYLKQLHIVLLKFKPSLFLMTMSSISNLICWEYFFSRHLLRLTYAHLRCLALIFWNDWILLQLFQLSIIPYFPLLPDRRFSHFSLEN